MQGRAQRDLQLVIPLKEMLQSHTALTAEVEVLGFELMRHKLAQVIE